MDIASEIAKEHSKAKCLQIADYVNVNTDRFKILMNVFFAGPYRITQRAAWPVNVCVERNPQLSIPYLKKLTTFLREPGIHPAVKRTGLRLLQFIEIPTTRYAELLDLCFEFLERKNEPVAIKLFAMILLEKLTKKYPELRRELKLV